MGQDTAARTQALFGAALKVPPGERSTFLESECDDPALRAEVESLLKYHETDDKFLSTPALVRHLGRPGEGPAPRRRVAKTRPWP